MHYKKVLELSITVGERLLFNGCATHRIEEQIHKILGVCPFTSEEVFVTTSGIVVTVDSPESGLMTMVKHTTKKGMNTERIALIEDIVINFTQENISVDEALKEIKGIADKSTYPFYIIVSAFALSGAFRSFMFGGSVYDSIAAVIVGLCVGITIQSLNTQKLPPFLVTLTAGFMVGFVSFLLRSFSVGTNLDKIIIGSLITFAPGVPMAHAINDILNGEQLSGIIRALEAILTGIAIAVGIAVALYFWRFLGGHVIE